MEKGKGPWHYQEMPLEAAQHSRKGRVQAAVLSLYVMRLSRGMDVNT